MRPPFTTVKDFVSDIGFELGAVRLCNVTAIRPARTMGSMVLLDLMGGVALLMCARRFTA